MLEFALKSQECIDSDYQGVCITEFTVLKADSLSKDEVVAQFIKSSAFSRDSLREVIKQNPDGGYLKGAFELDKISINDFRKFSKEQIAEYLKDLENEDWESDKIHFTIIKNKFLSALQTVKIDSFYVIDKNWFEQDNSKVRGEYEYWVYIYYFIILWIDSNNSTLTISVWTYD